MTDMVLNAGRKTTAGRSFYLVMALVLAVIATLGFSHTVPGDLAPPGLPLLLIAHAAVFVAWVLLFVAQPAFVVTGSLALHRTLGWVGIALAVAMVAMGGSAILFALHADTVPFFYPHGLFLVRGMVGLCVFAGLIVAAVARRRRGEWHKRLMLCASIVVIVPGLERALPVPAFGASWPFIVDGAADLLALAGPARDLIARGRIHPAYYWGVGAIVAGQALVDVVSPSSVAVAMLHAVGAR
jgi:hypothetical protein